MLQESRGPEVHLPAAPSVFSMQPSTDSMQIRVVTVTGEAFGSSSGSDSAACVFGSESGWHYREFTERCVVPASSSEGLVSFSVRINGEDASSEVSYFRYMNTVHVINVSPRMVACTVARWWC